MKILRVSDYRRMPWKNGKGETVEIAVFPPDASVDNFDWRISMATVSDDGPFSMFEGVDRTLSVLTGDGITLSVEGADAIDLKVGSQPHSFPADKVTSAALLGAAITDLNVMTRRGRFSHQVSNRSVAAGEIVTASESLVVAFALGQCTASNSEGDQSLDGLEAVLLEPEDEPVRFSADEPTSLIVVTLSLADRAA